MTIIPSWLMTEEQRKSEYMKVNLSYLNDPDWWGRKQLVPDEKDWPDNSVAVQIEHHKDTASRLIELAAWNMRQVEELTKC